MPHGVGVNKTRAGIAENLAEAFEHALPGCNVDARISDDQNVGSGICDQLAYSRRRVIFRKRDAHEISAGRTTITPAIRLLFRKSSSFCSITAPRLRDA